MVFLFGCVFVTLSVISAALEFWVVATVLTLPALILILIALRGDEKSVKLAGHMAALMQFLTFLS